MRLSTCGAAITIRRPATGSTNAVARRAEWVESRGDIRSRSSGCPHAIRRSPGGGTGAAMNWRGGSREGFTPVRPMFLGVNRIGDKYLIVGSGEGWLSPSFRTNPHSALPRSAKCGGIRKATTSWKNYQLVVQQPHRSSSRLSKFLVHDFLPVVRQPVLNNQPVRHFSQKAVGGIVVGRIFHEFAKCVLPSR